MAESMPQKIFTAMPTGEMDYLSRQWEEFAGCFLANLSEWDWTQLLHPEDRHELQAAWQHSLASGEPLQVTHRFRRNDGVYRWHLTRAHAMRTADEKVAMWIGSSTEIHEQKDTEEQLRNANRGLEEFAYVASHDLQEPLRMVNIYTQLLLREFQFPDASAREHAEFIRQGAKRMEELIRDLLSYSRAVHNDGATAGTADLSQSLSSALKTLEASLRETGAAVTAEPLPSVQGATEQLAHVFQNLLSNALKYRRKGVAPLVHISAELDGNQWIISVRDNGIGFEPQYAQQIFGLFKRLHSDEYAGTGLGLAICRRIVERAGGRIWAEGRPGNGATFYLSFPTPDGESQ